ncbi:MAG: YraN family protein [bacterium]|nr:YraN family protein [bacterium]
MSNRESTDKQKIGAIGEDTACRFLVKRGFKLLCRNYRKKWGEIDVIAENGKTLHFIEVKTVSRSNVTRETGSEAIEGDDYRPEDNIHPWKLERLGRAINSYLVEKDIDEDAEWQLDGVTVYLDIANKTAKVEYLENLVL